MCAHPVTKNPVETKGFSSACVVLKTMIKNQCVSMVQANECCILAFCTFAPVSKKTVQLHCQATRPTSKVAGDFKDTVMEFQALGSIVHSSGLFKQLQQSDSHTITVQGKIQ